MQLEVPLVVKTGPPAPKGREAWARPSAATSPHLGGERQVPMLGHLGLEGLRPFCVTTYLLTWCGWALTFPLKPSQTCGDGGPIKQRPPPALRRPLSIRPDDVTMVGERMLPPPALHCISRRFTVDLPGADVIGSISSHFHLYPSTQPPV